MSKASMSLPDKRHDRDGGGKYQYFTGYVLSLVLTAIAFALVAFHALPAPVLLVLLMVLAAIQVLVQLFLFMHVTEGDGSRVKGLAIGLGLFFTLAIALGSVWIMSFNSQVQ